MRQDRGAGTVLALGVLGASVALLLLCAPLVAVAVGHQRAASAADAAALAGADVALGAAVGVPCERAGEVAAMDGARLTRCSQDGAEVTVRVVVRVLALNVEAAARGGPPPGDRLRGLSERTVYGVREPGAAVRLRSPHI